MRRRASALLIVMLVMTIMLVTGMAVLSQRSLHYEGAVRARQAAQARVIAEAGLEEATLKLTKDPRFPPAPQATTEVYSYSEEFTDLDGVRIGCYVVEIDNSLRDHPHSILRLRSLGTLGERVRPTAQALVYAEIDLSRTERTPVTGTPATNGNFMRRVQFLYQEPPP